MANKEQNKMREEWEKAFKQWVRREDYEHYGQKKSWLAACEYQQEKIDVLVSHLSFCVGCLKNFSPFNGDLPEGLSPEMYQTLSYENDYKLLVKFTEAIIELQKIKELDESEGK